MMQMAVGLKHSAQVMGYVLLDRRERIQRIQDADPWMTMSRFINEAVDFYLPIKEKEMKLNPKGPSRSSPRS